MDIIKNVRCGSKPMNIQSCSTGLRYSYNIAQQEDEYGIYWVCDQYWFPKGEYESIQSGNIPGNLVTFEQEPELHRIFRTAQHDRSTSLVAMADRNIREGCAGWEEYRQALDAWNDAVSALAEGYSTEVPDLPESP